MKKWKIVVGVVILVVLFTVAGIATLMQMKRFTGMGNTRAEFAAIKSGSYNSLAVMDTVGTAYTVDKKAKTVYSEYINNTAEALTPAQNNYIKKIIKNADVTIEVKKIDEDFKKIAAWVEQNGGYEFSRNISSNEQNKHISVVYKITPDKLNSFMKFLGGSGTLLNSNIYSNDITDQYYDSAVRLENLKKGRDQLLEIQKKADTVDSLLKVQGELTRITGEIESLEGRMKMWDKMVAESTVNLNINQQSLPIKINRDITWNFSSLSDIIKTMKNGFVWTTNTIVNMVVWVVIFVVAIIPVAVIAAIIILIIKVIRKKKKE
jgi:hypothetical protein